VVDDVEEEDAGGPKNSDPGERAGNGGRGEGVG